MFAVPPSRFCMLVWVANGTLWGYKKGVRKNHPYHMNRLYILRFFAIFQYCSFLVEFFAFIHQTIVPVVNYAPFVIPF